MFEQDLRLIKSGAFKLPWDMTTPGHRQFSPFFLASQLRRFVAETSAVMGASARGSEETYKVPFGRSSLYPQYYQNNFHFQSGVSLHRQAHYGTWLHLLCTV